MKVKIIRFKEMGDIVPPFYLPYRYDHEKYGSHIAPIPLAIILAIWCVFWFAFRRAWNDFVAMYSKWKYDRNRII